MVLVAKGNHVTYTINGHLMTDLTDESPKALKDGVIALQLHAGFVMDMQFKDIEIKDPRGEMREPRAPAIDCDNSRCPMMNCCSCFAGV